MLTLIFFSYDDSCIWKDSWICNQGCLGRFKNCMYSCIFTVIIGWSCLDWISENRIADSFNCGWCFVTSS